MHAASANVAPTDVLLSGTTYAPPTATNNVLLGSLTSMDANVGQVHVYSIVGGANAAAFTIIGTSLLVKTAGQTGTGLQVTVRTDDQTGGTYDKTFTINESCDQLAPILVRCARGCVLR